MIERFSCQSVDEQVLEVEGEEPEEVLEVIEDAGSEYSFVTATSHRQYIDELEALLQSERQVSFR